MVETFSNPKTQRLLAALIEEKVMTDFPGVTGKLKRNLYKFNFCCITQMFSILASDLNFIKTAGGARSAICMDRRLKKDLVEQGILSAEDINKVSTHKRGEKTNPLIVGSYTITIFKM